MSFSKDSKQRLTAIGAVAIVALLGICAFLMFQNVNNNQTISQQNVEIDEAEKLKLELEKQYYESLSELEEMRGNSEELNAIIDQQKVELKEQKDKIARYIRQGKSTKSELAKAREEMSNLRVQMDGYISENNKLKADNEVLVMQNGELTVAKTTLEGEVATARVMNEELVTAKAALMSQKETLESENASLSDKVSIASVVKVQNVSGEGFKIRKSGKVKGKKRAGSVDRIKICFNATENAVVEGGLEKFYVRVINPTGETLAIENLGSGIMTTAMDEEEVRYTKVKEIDYNNQATDASCMLWEPNTEFQEGKYMIEVYNKGFLAGKGSFELK